MKATSKIYPNKPITRKLYLYGVEIEDLKTFTSILKTDKELCIKKFKQFFLISKPDDPSSVDGFDEQTIEDAYNMVEAIKSEDIFSEKFSNVEVRAAIMKYCSPEAVFSALEHSIIDTLTMTKRYPRLKICNKYGKPDKTHLLQEDIIVEYTTRKEEYSLIEITDRKLVNFLPWGQRSSKPSIIVLKMKCPSSGKDYYEYIDRKALIFIKEEIVSGKELTLTGFLNFKKWVKKEVTIKKDLKNTGELIKQAVAWQMRTQNRAPLTTQQYSQIISET